MRVALRLGRVGEQHADVLVRCAPRSLLGRSPDALLTAAGPEVLAACRQLRRTALRAGLLPGNAVVTGAGDLPATWLVHVGVPEYSVAHDHVHLLSAANRAVLAAADEVAAETVVMQPLGTQGPYWPLDDVIRVGLGALTNTPTQVRQTILVLPTAAALELVAEALVRRSGGRG